MHLSFCLRGRSTLFLSRPGFNLQSRCWCRCCCATEGGGSPLVSQCPVGGGARPPAREPGALSAAPGAEAAPPGVEDACPALPCSPCLSVGWQRTCVHSSVCTSLPVKGEGGRKEVKLFLQPTDAVEAEVMLGVQERTSSSCAYCLLSIQCIPYLHLLLNHCLQSYLTYCCYELSCIAQSLYSVRTWSEFGCSMQLFSCTGTLNPLLLMNHNQML